MHNSQENNWILLGVKGGVDCKLLRGCFVFKIVCIHTVIERVIFMAKKRKMKVSKNTNSSLHDGKKKKDGEFYTLPEDVEKETAFHEENIIGLSIVSPCDDPQSSAFYEFVTLNMKRFKTPEYISTLFEKDPNKKSYKLCVTKAGEDVQHIMLNGNGDCTGDECSKIIRTMDFLFTNPPFALIVEIILMAIEYKMKFLMVAPLMAATHSKIFPLIENETIGFGHTQPKMFRRPDGTMKTLGNCCWLTNLSSKRQSPPIQLFMNYAGNESNYKKYENCDAINIDRVTDIPRDYNGVMGVPISFLLKWDKDQFEIVKFRKGDDEKDLVLSQADMKQRNAKKKNPSKADPLSLAFRILIKYKQKGKKGGSK